VSSARQQQQVLALTRQLDADLRDTQKVLAQELLGLRQQVKVRQTWVVLQETYQRLWEIGSPPNTGSDAQWGTS
jgi:hypothetical protein